VEGGVFLESTPLENPDGANSEEENEAFFSAPFPKKKEEKKIFFLTKCLAEVYAQQGHTTMALEIYKRMLASNPTNQEIEQKITELEDHLWAKRGIKSKEQNT
jgi:hypothetical protein